MIAVYVAKRHDAINGYDVLDIGTLALSYATCARLSTLPNPHKLVKIVCICVLDGSQSAKKARNNP